MARYNHRDAGLGLGAFDESLESMLFVCQMRVDRSRVCYLVHRLSSMKLAMLWV